ncbi:MAG TPA: hypothetical protein VL069_09530 [Opitutus sp.]|nr:hypothetical protein [Opitutus sp.]
MTRLLALLLLTIAFGCNLSAAVTESFSQSYPISPTGVLRLENVNGLVEITAWDKNEISVEAIKSAPEAEDLARIQLKIESTPDRLSIETEYKKKLLIFGTWRGEVHYTLRVPATLHLERISVINDGIRVRNVTGPMHLKAINSHIDATGLAGTGRFETVNGELSIGYSSVEKLDAISLRTVNGRCDLTLPKDAPFSVDSKSVNGGVRTDFPIKIEKSGLAHFRGSLGEGGPKIDFGSVNGELVIHHAQ